MEGAQKCFYQSSNGTTSNSNISGKVEISGFQHISIHSADLDTPGTSKPQDFLPDKTVGQFHNFPLEHYLSNVLIVWQQCNEGTSEEDGIKSKDLLNPITPSSLTSSPQNWDAPKIASLLNWPAQGV